jgi:hypothetical protein
MVCRAVRQCVKISSFQGSILQAHSSGEDLIDPSSLSRWKQIAEKSIRQSRC